MRKPFSPKLSPLNPIRPSDRSPIAKFIKQYTGKFTSVQTTITPIPVTYKGHTKNLVYIKFTDHKIAKTKQVDKKVYIDYDRRKEIVGIEII